MKNSELQKLKQERIIFNRSGMLKNVGFYRVLVGNVSNGYYIATFPNHVDSIWFSFTNAWKHVGYVEGYFGEDWQYEKIKPSQKALMPQHLNFLLGLQLDINNL